MVDGQGNVTETLGGYEAWLKTAGGEGTTDVNTPRKEKPRGSQRLRLSYKEQRELETIEGDISALEGELERVGKEQEEKGSDYLALEKLQLRQTELEAALEEKMERWLYLKELEEQIRT